MTCCCLVPSIAAWASLGCTVCSACAHTGRAACLAAAEWPAAHAGELCFLSRTYACICCPRGGANSLHARAWPDTPMRRRACHARVGQAGHRARVINVAMISGEAQQPAGVDLAGGWGWGLGRRSSRHHCLLRVALLLHEVLRSMCCLTAETALQCHCKSCCARHCLLMIDARHARCARLPSIASPPRNAAAHLGAAIWKHRSHSRPCTHGSTNNRSAN